MGYNHCALCNVPVCPDYYPHLFESDEEMKVKKYLK